MRNSKSRQRDEPGNHNDDDMRILTEIDQLFGN